MAAAPEGNRPREGLSPHLGPTRSPRRGTLVRWARQQQERPAGVPGRAPRGQPLVREAWSSGPHKEWFSSQPGASSLCRRGHRVLSCVAVAGLYGDSSPVALSMHPFLTHLSCSTGHSRPSRFRNRGCGSMSTHWGSCSAEGCPQLMTVPSTATPCDPVGVTVRAWPKAVATGWPARDWRLGGTEDRRDLLAAVGCTPWGGHQGLQGPLARSTPKSHACLLQGRHEPTSHFPHPRPCPCTDSYSRSLQSSAPVRPGCSNCMQRMEGPWPPRGKASAMASSWTEPTSTLSKGVRLLTEATWCGWNSR